MLENYMGPKGMVAQPTKDNYKYIATYLVWEEATT